MAWRDRAEPERVRAQFLLLDHAPPFIRLEGTLQQVLPEFYYAQSSQRVWLEYSQRYLYWR